MIKNGNTGRTATTKAAATGKRFASSVLVACISSAGSEQEDTTNLNYSHFFETIQELNYIKNSRLMIVYYLQHMIKTV